MTKVKRNDTKKHIFIKISLVLAILVLQFNDFYSVFTMMKDNPVITQILFENEGEDTFIDNKTSLVRTGKNTRATVRLTPHFSLGFKPTEVRVNVWVPSFDINKSGELVAKEVGSQSGVVGFQAKPILDESWVVLENEDNTPQKGGWLKLAYIGDFSEGKMPAFSLDISEYSNDSAYRLPEGTGGEFFAYTSYTYGPSDDEKVWTTAGEKDPESIVNVITSNLEWETSIKDINPEQQLVPWDRTHYGDYHVSLENTSDNTSSMIEGYQISLNIDSTQEGITGIIPEDINRWIYDDGKITENKDPVNNISGKYVGVEGKGGILIYDVTENPDLEEEKLGEPLPYTYTGAGMIMIHFNDQKLQPSEGKVTKENKREYLVRLPYAAQGFKSVPVEQKVRLTTEINFAKNKKWTKSDVAITNILDPSFNLSLEKEAVKPKVVFSQKGAYLLKGVQNKSTIPVFNPRIVDYLPEKGFELNQIEIITPYESLEEEFSDVLLTYIHEIKKDGEYHQKKEHISIDQFERLDEKQGDKYVFTASIPDFMNHSVVDNAIHIHLKDRLNVSETIDSEIKLKGIMSSVGDIKNKSKIIYDEKRSNSDILSDVTYEITEHEEEIVDANIKVTYPDPIKPVLKQTAAFNQKEKDNVILGYERKASHRFYVGNNSETESEKGTLSINLNHHEERLVSFDKFVLYEEMINKDLIESLEFVVKDGKRFIYRYRDGQFVGDHHKVQKVDGSYVFNSQKIDFNQIEEIKVIMKKLPGKSDFFLAELFGTALMPLGKKHSVNSSLEIWAPEPFSEIEKLDAKASWEVTKNNTKVKLFAKQTSIKESYKNGEWVDYVPRRRNHYDGLDKALDVGYKTIASYTYDLTRGESASDNMETSFKTTVHLPHERFDTYYLRMPQKVAEQVDYIEVYRSDEKGKEFLWKTFYGGKNKQSQVVINSQSENKNAQSFWRINVAHPKSSQFFDTLEDLTAKDHPYYKNPFSKDVVPEKPVSKVVVHYLFDDEAKEPYEKPDLAGKTKDALEITGRFYHSSEKEEITELKVDETLGRFEPFKLNELSDKIAVNVHNSRAQTTMGTEDKIKTNKSIIETGQEGSYVVNITNNARSKSIAKKEMNKHDEWGDRYWGGHGVREHFFDNLVYTFEYPKETKNKSENFYFDPTEIVIGDKVKKHAEIMNVILDDDVKIDIPIKENLESIQIERVEDPKPSYSDGVLSLPKKRDLRFVKVSLLEINGVGDQSFEFKGVDSHPLNPDTSLDLKFKGIVVGNKELKGTSYLQNENQGQTEQAEYSEVTSVLQGKTLSLKNKVEITSIKNGNSTYDFQADGLTPNVSEYAVNLKNNGEANIHEIDFELNFSRYFRINDLNIPDYLMDGENWYVESVKVGNTELLKYFEGNRLDFSKLFEEGILKRELVSYSRDQSLYKKDDVRQITINLKAKGDYVLKGSIDAEDEKEQLLYPDGDDLTFSGVFVEKAEDEDEYGLKSRPTYVVKYDSSNQYAILQHKVNTEVKTPNKYTNPKDKASGQATISTTFRNRRAKMELEGIVYSQYGKGRYDDGLDIALAKAVPHDRLNLLVNIHNTGEKAKNDASSGNLKVYNPVLDFKLEKGLKLTNWKIVKDKSNVNPAVHDELENVLTEVSDEIKLMDLNTRKEYRMGDPLPKDIVDFEIVFEDTVVDYGERLFVDFELEVKDAYEGENQGKKIKFNGFSRPELVHGFDSYYTSRGKNKKGVSTSTSTYKFDGKSSDRVSKISASNLIFADPVGGSIRLEFNEENISSYDATLTISDIKNELEHDDTQLELIVDLDRKGNQGFVLTEKPQINNEKGSLKNLEDVQIFGQIEDEFIEMAQIKQEDLFKVKKVKVNYGFLDARKDDEILALDDLKLYGKGYYRKEKSEVAKSYVIEPEVKFIYTHRHNGKHIYSNSQHDQQRVLKGMPNIHFRVDAVDENDDAKFSFVENEHFYYLIRAENKKAKVDKDGKNPYGTAPLEKPVIIDRIPEYVRPNFLEEIKKDGSKNILTLNENIQIKIVDKEKETSRELKEVEVVVRKDKIKDIGGSQLFKVPEYRDEPLKGHNDYSGKLSMTQPNDLKNNPAGIINIQEVQFLIPEDLKPGEELQIRYQVQARGDHLPQAYYHKKGEPYAPVYAPFLGWYGDNKPVAGEESQYDEPMTMDLLFHETGITGSLSFEQSPKEFLTKSQSKLQGMEVSTKSFYDGSARVSSEHQTELQDEKENQFLTSGKTSDMYEIILKNRFGEIKYDGFNRILWSNDMIRHKKAWLASHSQFIPEKENHVITVDNPSNFYEHDKNLKNSVIYLGKSKYHYDNYTYAVELHEEFTTRLHAFNYGDKSIDGIEFIEVLPIGISPQSEVCEELDVKAYIGDKIKLHSGKSNYRDLSSYEYRVIDPKKVHCEIIQTPSTKNPKYKAPKNFHRKSIEGIEYYEEQIPYVIKITVDEELGPWFDRKENERLDYMMYVDIPTVVSFENHNEAWYDLLIAQVKENDHNRSSEIYSNFYGNYTDPSFPRQHYNTHYMGKDAMNEGMNVEKSYYQYRYGSWKNNKFEPYGPYVSGGENVLPMRKEKQAISMDKLKLRKPVLRTMVHFGEYSDKDFAVDMYDEFKARILVNNLMFGDLLSHQRSPVGHSSQAFTDAYLYRSQTSGGARGSYIDPVITVLLPYGIKVNEADKTQVILREYQGLEFKELENISSKAEFKLDWIESLSRYRLQISFSEELFVRYNQGLEIIPSLEVVDYPKIQDDMNAPNQFEDFYVFASSKREVFRPVVEDRFKPASAPSKKGTKTRNGKTLQANDRQRFDSVGENGSIGISKYFPLSETFSYEETDTISFESHSNGQILYLDSDFLSHLNQDEEREKASETGTYVDRGVYSTAKLMLKSPRIKSQIKIRKRLDSESTLKPELSAYDKFYYDISVENISEKLGRSRNDQFAEELQKGKVHHADIMLYTHLPKFVDVKEAIFLEILKDDGSSIRLSPEEAQAKGILVERISNEEHDKNGIVTHRIRMNEEGRGFIGEFRHQDSISLVFEAHLARGFDSSEGDKDKWVSPLLTTKNYTRIDNRDGQFNDQQTVLQPDKQILYANEVIEFLDTVNKNGMFRERFDYSQVELTVFKPQGFIRKNMTKPRHEFPNGSTSDPYYTSSETIEYVMTQVNNLESDVASLVIEDVLPYYDRLHKHKTEDDYRSASRPIETNVHSVRTGKYVIPDAYQENFAEDITDKYRTYVYISEKLPSSHYDDVEDWTLLNPEGTPIVESKNITIPKAKRGKVRRIRWVIRSNNPEEYLIPKGFRMDADLGVKQGKVVEISDLDPENKSVEVYSEQHLANAPAVSLNAITKEPKTAFIYNGARLYAEYTKDRFALLDTSQTRAHLTPSAPVVDIVYSNEYFRFDRNREGKNKFAWDSTLLVNPNISSTMKYRAEIISADQSMWTEEENRMYTEDTYVDPSIIFALPTNFKIDAEKLTFVDASRFDKENPLHSDYASNRRIDDLYTWTWHIERKDPESLQQSDLKLVGKPYVGPWKKMNQNIFRLQFEGKLYPGDKLIIEYMGKVLEYDPSKNMEGVASQSKVMALNDTGLLTPLNTEKVKDRILGYSIDYDDVNDNNKINDRLVSAQSQFFEYAGFNDFPKGKMSYSDFEPGKVSHPNISSVLEGGYYYFDTSVSNPNPVSSSGYNYPMMLEVLPHVGDSQIIGYKNIHDEFVVRERDSKWSGWFVADASTFTLKEIGRQGEKLFKYPSDYTLYVGPFRKEGKGKSLEIHSLDMDNFPDSKTLSDPKFYQGLKNKGSELKQYFVSLDELMKYNPELSKDIKVLLPMMKDPNYKLSPETKLTFSFKMKAPLNTPFYNENLDNLEPEHYRANNTFSGWQDSTGFLPAESNTASVMIKAPKKRAYIGDYIWLDRNQNGKVDEGTTSKDENGRELLTEFEEDPGINDVLVELYTPDGYPSDEEGRPVVNYEGSWVVVNTETGLPLLDEDLKMPIPAGEPVRFISESDWKGRQGYYILPNLNEAKYRLKFSFPKEYDDFLPTHSIMNGVKLYNFKKDDLIDDSFDRLHEKADGLTVFTDVIDLKVGKSDAYYTDFDLGIYKTAQVGGKVFLEGNKSKDKLGYYDQKNDKELEGFELALRYEDGRDVLDAQGNPQRAVSDSKGNYVFNSVPVNQKIYVELLDAKSYRVSSYRYEDNPLKVKDDNDLYVDGKILRTEDFVIDESTWERYRSEIIDRIYLGLERVSAKASIGNFVWLDLNRNGIQDPDEPGLEGVELILEKYILKDGKFQKTMVEEKTESNEKGYYYFKELPSSIMIDKKDYLCAYKVRIDQIPSGYTFTKPAYNPDATEDTDSNAMPNGSLSKDYLILSEKDDKHPLGYNVAEAKPILNVDAGFVDIKFGSISGQTFIDENRNHLRDEDEEFYPNARFMLEVKIGEHFVPVQVDEKGHMIEPFSEQDGSLYHVESSDGQYRFDHLIAVNEKTNKPYEYRVVAEIDEVNVEAVDPFVGDDPKIDSDFEMQGGRLLSPILRLIEEEEGLQDYDYFNIKDIEHIDLGLVVYPLEMTIGTHVFEDVNDNHIRDDKDLVLPGIPLILYRVDENGTLVQVDKTISDARGQYQFKVPVTNLEPESSEYLKPYRYYVLAEKEGYQEFVKPFVGENHQQDSDFTVLTEDNEWVEDRYWDYALSPVITTKQDENGQIIFKEVTDHVHVDLGLKDYGEEGLIYGSVIEDVKKNSILEKESFVEGISVHLYQKTSSGYQYIRSTQSDEQGFYQFNVERADFNKESSSYLQGYEYLVLAEKEGHMLFSDYKVEGSTEETSSDFHICNSKMEQLFDKHHLDQHIAVTDEIRFTEEEKIDLSTAKKSLKYDLGIQLYPRNIRIGSFVFEDKNGNGIFDKGEKTVSDIEVYLYRQSEEGWNVIASTQTDEKGFYEFTVEAGNFDKNSSEYLRPYDYVVILKKEDYFDWSPYKVLSASEETDSDIFAMSDEAKVNYSLEDGDWGISRSANHYDLKEGRMILSSIRDDLNIDAGIVLKNNLARIGDEAFIDVNQNGIIDRGVDKPLQGVKVILEQYDFAKEKFSKINSTYTDHNGRYSFEVEALNMNRKSPYFLKKNIYRIRMIAPRGYVSARNKSQQEIVFPSIVMYDSIHEKDIWDGVINRLDQDGLFDYAEKDQTSSKTTITSYMTSPLPQTGMNSNVLAYVSIFLSGLFLYLVDLKRKQDE